MAITNKLHILDEARSDNDVTRVFVADDEIMQVNPDSAWEIDRVLSDYQWGNDLPTELIVVFKRKKAEEGE